jgi:hypothetical protein
MCDTDDNDDLSYYREKKKKDKASICWQVSTGVCVDYLLQYHHYQTNVITISYFIIFFKSKCLRSRKRFLSFRFSIIE